MWGVGGYTCVSHCVCVWSEQCVRESVCVENERM